MTTIATIGAGHIGTAVARIALTAGYDVVLSTPVVRRRWPGSSPA